MAVGRGRVIRFKAEASAWTPQAVQLQQVWTDPPARRQGFAGRALRDLIRLLLSKEHVELNQWRLAVKMTIVVRESREGRT